MRWAVLSTNQRDRIGTMRDRQGRLQGGDGKGQLGLGIPEGKGLAESHIRSDLSDLRIPNVLPGVQEGCISCLPPKAWEDSRAEIWLEWAFDF